jgi:prepilin-type N-terminal cleavage/methylation domain-containing protein
MLKRQAGFTLIEIILTLILIGILSVFAGLFMTSFISSYSLVRSNSDTAMKAQMAMDRISMELRDVSAVTALTVDSLITYTNPQGAGRTIRQVGSNIFLSTPTNNILLDGVQAFQLSATYRNVYNIAANDMAFIDIGFTIAGTPAFSTRIFPRIRIPQPP